MLKNFARAALSVLVFSGVLGSAAAPAYAQIPFEIAGTRALGMAGAFVAVADDASATHWNPAGLASAGKGNMTIGWDHLRFGDPNAPAMVGASDDSTALTSVTTYPVAFTYGYYRTSRIIAIADDGTPVVNALVVHHYGASYAQKLGGGLSIAGTFKYLSGKSTTGVTDSQLNDALEEGLKRDGDSDGHVDVDVGLMGAWTHFRAGLVMKNLTQPTFLGSAGFEIQVKRRIRAGVAVLPTNGLTLAFDVDLDTADPLVGLRRMMATGLEWRLGSTFALRGGVRWSRDGEKRPIASVGGSVLIRQGMWLDGFTTYSRFDDRGFGIAFRAGS
jgi:hypothetical protein